MVLVSYSMLITVLVLHPQMKLKYFQQQKWSKDWIDTAKEIVREEFAKYKVPDAIAAATVSRCYYFFCSQARLHLQPYTG